MCRILSIFFLSISVNAQEVILSGTIKDSVGTILTNTNILAFPESNNHNTSFAISNGKGEYQLKLVKDAEYKLEISYLGFQKISTRVTLTQDTIKDFVLKTAVNELEEVVLNYKIPVKIKKDTIIYNADSFRTGKERKVRELLKNMPGIKVDREGNVSAQGKKVDKVMVDGKVFFTGNSKLAVNNIPADAVEEIEILDNYNEVGFLKGLQDSDEMAMNIRLKEDKKKFTFGDFEIGGGFENRYTVHPSIFYYSPKTNLNFIGDMNNIGQKSFTIKDYIEFEGGFGKLLNNIETFKNLYQDDFANYLGNDDFKENINRFGALNIRQSISRQTNINAYLIANGSSADIENQTLNRYSNNGNPFIETRNSTNALDNFFIIGKVTLDYEPNTNEDLALNTFVKLSDNTSEGQILTQNPEQENIFATSGSLNGFSVNQNLEYSKKFSKAHTASLETTLSYSQNRPRNNWISNQAFLNNFIPLENDSIYDIFQQKETQNITFDAVVKEYWVLNNYNHVYTTIGTSLTFEDYTSMEIQKLTNGEISNFGENDFGNSIAYRFNDLFLGLEHKFLAGMFTVKSALFYHNYYWENTQLENRISNKTSFLFPELKATAEFNSSEKLKFSYRIKPNFPNAQKLAGNFLLTDFNRIFRGNKDLGPERTHSLALNYYKFSLFKGLNLNAGLFFDKRTQSIKNTTELQGIDQFTALNMFDIPENNFKGDFNLSEEISNFKFFIEARGSYSEFFQIVNDNTSKNISKTLSVKGKVKTSFNKAPNFELSYTFAPTTYKTDFTTSEFENNRIDLGLDYAFFEDFRFKAEYSRTDYSNRGFGISNSFDIADALVSYQKQDSPWGFEVAATNLFDTQFKQSNSFTDFLISDTSVFILPRMVLLKIYYKL